MADVLAANRAAVIDLLAATERSAAAWNAARAWEVVAEPGRGDVAGGLEEAANVVSGAKGWKAAEALNPTSGPATPAQARVRLEGALARFDQECRRRVASGQYLVSTGFGTVSVEDLVRFS